MLSKKTRRKPKKPKRNVFVMCAFVTLIIILLAIRSQMDKNLPTLSKTLEFNKKNLKLKYALIWTSQKYPLVELGRGCGTFHKRNCSFKNCYITSNRRLFNDTSKFDAIVFHGPEIIETEPQKYLPTKRAPNQSYIFASMESSHVYILDTRYNHVFNYTWTYKLNSDINFGYMTIRDHAGKVIGPNVSIPWLSIEDMLPINDTIKTKLANKSIAAAWFVSNCNTPGKRERLALNVITKLRTYNMTVDVYGRCGYKLCPKKSMDKCLQKLQRDYYFYFAFENSLSEDYVTEKLLRALQNYVVPIVYGGAEYKRFMPNGIYLNAREMTVVTLVKHMIRIIRDKSRYYDFFKWHNHYSYHDSEEMPDTDPFCSFCSFMNQINNSKSSTVKKLNKWWDV